MCLTKESLLALIDIVIGFKEDCGGWGGKHGVQALRRGGSLQRVRGACSAGWHRLPLCLGGRGRKKKEGGVITNSTVIIPQLMREE